MAEAEVKRDSRLAMASFGPRLRDSVGDPGALPGFPSE